MADTTEARRLADELAADVAALLREGLPQEAMRADAAQSALRALADENERMRGLLDMRPAGTKLYTDPTARQALTDEQIAAMRQAGYLDADDYPDAWAYERGVRDAERAHGIGGKGGSA